MTAEELKASVLQMAMEGRLVPQRDDEPAVDIDVEEPDDVPFAIPEKWKWCSLMDVVEVISSKQYQIQTKDVLENGKYPVVSQSKDLLDGYCNDRNKLLEKNNIPIVVFGDHTKVVKFINFQFIVGADGTKLLHNKSNINIKYLYYVIKYNIIGIKNGGYSRHFKFLKVRPVPLPPLEEQRRIVERLDEILSVVEKYGQAHDALQSMEKELPGKLRASLLQEAISGRLVPQRDDEPAVDIDVEEPDDVPFAIPGKWKWVRLGDIFTLKAGKFINAHEITKTGKYPCYGGNGIRGYVDHSNRKGHFPLIGRQGALCGNINIVKGEFYATEHAVVVDCHDYGNPECVGFFLKAMNLNQYATATAQPGLSVKKINELYFPLPPLAEQRRIVERLNELLPSVEAMEKLYQQ